LNINEKIRDLRIRLDTNKTILENASPQTIFDRGYSMVTDENGKIIRSSEQVSEGAKLTITPAEGKIHAVVTK
jgi:exodeoxyribonuclease VII large subunit